MLHIRQATNTEINELLMIYIDKVKWLRLHNTPMWDESQFTIENIHSKYESPVFYIGSTNGTIIGGFILIEYDRVYWPDRIHDNAYYFHKFVIRNEYCGKGYADEILQWVIQYGQAHNKEYIRLDYDGNRKYIRDLYTRNGFVPVETIQNEKVARLIKAEYVIRHA